MILLQAVVQHGTGSAALALKHCVWREDRDDE